MENFIGCSEKLRCSLMGSRKLLMDFNQGRHESMDASEEHSSHSRYGKRVKALGNQGGGVLGLGAG